MSRTSINCINCKYADKHNRYCYKWEYPRCENHDWCSNFKQDTTLNIIVREIWRIDPNKVKMKRSELYPYHFPPHMERDY